MTCLIFIDTFRGLLFILPGVFYVIYYFSIKFTLPLAERRISPELDILLFGKSMVMQVLGTFDSFVGPSAFIKLYYSAASIGLLSMIIATVILIVAWRYLGQQSIKDNADIAHRNFKHLLLGAVSVLLLSLVMFSLTGLYVPSPFNLGNRSLVYGSLLVAVLLVSLPINRKTLLLLWLIFVLPVFGLSDHWKAWNREQLSILQNIQNHEGLQALQNEDMLIIIGHNYSKLGPYSHIDFFCMPWVVSAIFRDFAAVNQVAAITPTATIVGDDLVDSKFGARYSLTGNVYIYNTEDNILKPGSRDDVDRLIKKRSPEIRHWVQLTKGTFIETTIVSMSPRLNYLFN